MINYKEIGSRLEHTEDQDELAEFKKKYWRSTDSAMASLAVYALYRLSSMCERKAGRINQAQLTERNAQTIYERDIKPENRW